MTDAQLVIREARPDDAAKLIAYIKDVAAEPRIDFVLMPDEFEGTLDDEVEWMRQHALADNSLLIVADVGGEVVGLLNCTGGRRRASRGTAVIGISVRKDWRDKGVGRRMMEYAMEWARGSGIIKRVELEVFTRNSRAVHLYENVGFKIEGTMRKRFYRDDEYIDCHIMAVLFD